MYHFRESHHYHIHNHITQPRRWLGNVVGVRHAEVVHILEQRERERERERVTNLPIFMLMVMVITKNDNNPR